MSNLLQIRTQFLSRISQNPTLGQVDFTTDEQNSLANEGTRFLAVRCEYPRDIVSIALETGKSVYSLITDNLNIIQAYLTDSSNHKPKVLRLLGEKEMVQVRPTWMDESVTGIPDTVLLLNRQEIFVSPTPNADSNGKKVFLSYNYYPATMVNDTDTPDLPTAFHDLIPIYMAHSAYSGKLQSPQVALALMSEFESKFKILNTPATREKDQMNFFFSGGAGLDYEWDYGIDPTR